MMENNAKELRMAWILGFFMFLSLISGCPTAQPKREQIVSKIRELQSGPTTPDNLQDRSKEIRQLLGLLERKKGQETVEQIVSIETRHEFKKAMRAKDYDTACRIADEIIRNLAEFAGISKGARDDSRQEMPLGDDRKALSMEYRDSPFGFHSAYYDVSPFKHAQEVGARWDRGTGLGTYITPMPRIMKGRSVDKRVIAEQVRARIREKVYDLSYFDEHIKRVPPGMHVVENIGPVKKEATPWVKFFNRPDSWLPKDEYMDYYLTFVQKVVERYDGDGMDDMPGLKSPIKYWQISNEPHYRQNIRDLAKLVMITQPVIKSADPEARIILGGASLQPMVDGYLKQLKMYYYPILGELRGGYIDVFDFHWYGKADGDYKTMKTVYENIRKNLDQLGYKNAEIWVTEMGTYSGAPGGKRYNWPVQTEREQAIDLLKRYVYSLSLGIKKIFWAWGMVEGFPPADDNHFYDHTGLIYDGKKLSSKDVDRGKGVKKLAFYAYKMMTDKLEGADWDKIEKLEERDGIHIYKVAKKGKYIWVAWNDNKDEKEIFIRGIKSKGVKIVEAVPRHGAGKDIKDVQKAFKIKLKTTDKEKVSLTLDQIPVFVEEE